MLSRLAVPDGLRLAPDWRNVLRAPWLAPRPDAPASARDLYRENLRGIAGPWTALNTGKDLAS